ncbi:MAG: hypothetical protein FE78DRAFT_34681 [Acidomyces sp. 'richmondensis']|nr:MAG: hypothetical protein FE78DRAFT_34681 [Acidomyces sp. 'richmondensis']
MGLRKSVQKTLWEIIGVKGSQKSSEWLANRSEASPSFIISPFTPFKRRTVSHVIIGSPSRIVSLGVALSKTKTPKEILRRGGNAVTLMTTNWVTESIKASKNPPNRGLKG